GGDATLNRSADCHVVLLKAFELKSQNPHPGPLPSDGRGRIEGRVRNCGRPLNRPSRFAGCSLSRRMGEGQGEGSLAFYRATQRSELHPSFTEDTFNLDKLRQHS